MTESAGAHHSDHPMHGNIGDEAAKLAEAVQDWLARRTGRTSSDVWAAATSTDGLFDSPECRVCPICRGMKVFTSLRPEVFEHLADAAASFSAAVRAMADEAVGVRPDDAVDAEEPSGEA